MRTTSLLLMAVFATAYAQTEGDALLVGGTAVDGLASDSVAAGVASPLDWNLAVQLPEFGVGVQPLFGDSARVGLWMPTVSPYMQLGSATTGLPPAAYLGGEVAGTATLFQWRGGAIVASGSVQDYPGLMGIESGTLGYYGQYGRWSLYVAGVANKYGYRGGVATQYGVTAYLSYRISSRLSATAFGSYYFGGQPRMADGSVMSPAMAGYYNTTRVGGQVDYTASEHFGVAVGGQVVLRNGPMGSRYEVEPIATPYVNIGKGKNKVSIGLPVGQILNGLIRR